MRQLADDKRMVEGLVLGDEAAAERFVREFEPRIRLAVREAGIPTADVPDVTQEIMIEAIRQLSSGGFEHRSSVRTWLRRLTEGRIVDYRRFMSRRGQGKHVPIESLDVEAPSFQSPAGQEARVCADQALAMMPARHRLAILAHYRGGVPVDELARSFGLSIPRTRAVLGKAKRLFRRYVLENDRNVVRKRLKGQGNE